MLRDANLAPLSRQHQHALALCVRIRRALAPPEPAKQMGSTDSALWCEEVARLFGGEIRHHFDAEEELLFPAAGAHAELATIVARLREQHGTLRAAASEAAAAKLDSAALLSFAELLSAHVRLEENELFEAMQRMFSVSELEEIGARTAAFFAARGLTGPACGLP
jgi:hemerythrin-like domain-containing protein